MWLPYVSYYLFFFFKELVAQLVDSLALFSGYNYLREPVMDDLLNCYSTKSH